MDGAWRHRVKWRENKTEKANSRYEEHLIEGLLTTLSVFIFKYCLKLSKLFMWLYFPKEGNSTSCIKVMYETISTQCLIALIDHRDV